MDNSFWLDWETRSEALLDEVGLSNYVEHPSTQIILGQFARGDRKVQVWEPHKTKIPAELEDALLDPFTIVEAHNAIFEKLIAQNCLKISKPIEEFRCTMARCRYLSLPGGLGAAGEILGLSESQAKIKDGKRLIRLFCEPESCGGAETLFGTSQPLFRDWSTDPADWAAFVAYGKQDVEAARAIGKKLKKFPLPDFEWETWFLSERINSNGLPTDEKLIAGARFLVDKETRRLVDQLKELTGLDNPNSITQLLPWLQDRGFIFDSLGKPFVARAVAGEGELSDEAKLALEIRGQTSKSSVKKYTVIADTVSPDGRLRNAYQFLGAARTGRFSSLGANLSNLSKPSKQVEKELDVAIELVQKMDYDGIVAKFGKPMDVVSGVLRSSFRAPEGKKFVVADLVSIEARGLAYLSHCKAMLAVFEKGLDPYIEFATRMYGGTYEELYHEYKVLGNSTKRTNSKPPVLGCGYGLGPGEEKIDPETEISTWTGLMGYSRAMNVEMSAEEATAAVKAFREAYPEVKWLWRDMQNAAAKAIRNPGQVVGVGAPQSDRDREYFAKIGREIHEPLISFLCHGTKVLEMILPSGRSLHYIDPIAREEDSEYQGKTYKRTVVEYQGKEQGSQQWGIVTTHGGKWTENCLSSETLVITRKGMKQIADLSDSDLLWDGVEWVSHGGLLNQGVQETIEWLEVWMTKEHLILVGNEWVESQNAGSRIAGALSTGRDLVSWWFFGPNPEKKEDADSNVTAEENTKPLSATYTDETYRNVPRVEESEEVKSKRQHVDTESSKITNFGKVGYTEELESYHDASIRTAKPTTTMEVGESPYTSRGLTVPRNGYAMSLPSPIGTSPEQTLTGKTMMETTNRETCELLAVKQIAIIAGQAGSSPITKNLYPTPCSEKNISQSGPRTLSGGTLTRENQSKKSLNTTELREVFDIRGCGPRNRFAIMSGEGPVIVHNCDQAISRDILVHGMKLAEKKGFEIVLTTYDEIGALVPVDSPLGVKELCECMSTQPAWCKGAFPLAAEGFESVVYKK